MESFITTAADVLTLGLINVADWTRVTVSPAVTPTKTPPVITIDVVPSYVLVLATVPVTVNIFWFWATSVTMFCEIPAVAL